MASNVIDYVCYWKRKLDKNPDEEDVSLRAIHKLSKIPVTPEILEATHIGKTIRNLSKRNDEVGEKAKILLKKWRNIFADLQSARSSKQKSMNKEENGEESSSKHTLTQENVSYHEKVSSHKQKEKHKKSHSHHSSSKQFSEKPSKSHSSKSDLDESEKKLFYLKDVSHSKSDLDESEKKLFYLKDVSHSSKSDLDESEKKLFYLKGMSFQQSMEDSVLFHPDNLKTSGSSDDDDDDKRKKPSSNTSSLKRKLATEEKLEEYDVDPKKMKLSNHSSSDGKKKKEHKFPVDKNDSFCDMNVKKEKSSPLHSVKQSSSSHSKKEKSDSSEKNADSKTLKPTASIQSSDGFTSSSVSFEACLGFNDVVTVKKKKSSKSQSSTKKNDSSSEHSQNKLADKKVSENSANKKRIYSNHVSKKSKEKLSKNASKKSKMPDVDTNHVSKASKEKLSKNVSKKSKMPDVPEVVSTSNSAVQPQPTFKSPQNQGLKKESISNEDVIKFTSSRKEKTAIYSGRKNINKTFPTLAQCCCRVLIENIDILGPMGDTPYELLKPILEKCSPNQLFNIEKYNPHLLYNTNELWKIHCKRDYKLLSPLEHETWRDVYLRGFDEREEKLKNITANISASMLKATPVRQLKLAFVDSYVKPPREVLRRQAKHRLLEPSSVSPVKPVLSPKENTKKIETQSSSSATNQVSVSDKKDKTKINKSSLNETPNHLPSSKGNGSKPSIVDPTASDKDVIALSLAAKKPKVAPLMAKTLKTMKQCFRR